MISFSLSLPFLSHSRPPACVSPRTCHHICTPFPLALCVWLARHTQLGDLEGAVENCTQALDCDDSYTKALLKRAELHMELEQFQEAVNDYETALEADPSSNGACNCV